MFRPCFLRLLRPLLPDMTWEMADRETVYLTFDDGPTPGVTEWVLKTLAGYGVRATFFCLGKNVEQHPELYRAIREAGHRVGNHSYSHIKGWGMPTEQYVEDVDLAGQLIESDLFRPPYGRIRRRQAEVLSARYRLVMGNVVSQDYSLSVSPRECLRNARCAAGRSWCAAIRPKRSAIPNTPCRARSSISWPQDSVSGRSALRRNPQVRLFATKNRRRRARGLRACRWRRRAAFPDMYESTVRGCESGISKGSIDMKKIVVAVTGASGAIYARKVVERLLQSPRVGRVAVVCSANGRRVMDYERERLPEGDRRLVRYDNDDMFAPPASGSAGYDGMVVVPCSMGSAGRIAAGISGDLIGRAADVMLKERRPLVLVVRETPLSTVHLRNLTALSECGAVVLPASPSFYAGPADVETLCDTVAVRAVRMLGIAAQGYEWGAQE